MFQTNMEIDTGLLKRKEKSFEGKLNCLRNANKIQVLRRKEGK